TRLGPLARALALDHVVRRVRQRRAHDERRVVVKHLVALRLRHAVLATCESDEGERRSAQRRHLTIASCVSAFLMQSSAESVMRRPTQLGKSDSASLRRSACIFWMLGSSVMFF